MINDKNKNDNSEKTYAPNEYISHTGVLKVLADLRGFRVKKDTLPPFTWAHVGMIGDNEIVYIEYTYGPGDSFVVKFMRPANKEELDFYYGTGSSLTIERD